MGQANHEHAPGVPHTHLEDPDANLRALASDLEYFRTARLLSFVLQLLRRGWLEVADLLESDDRLRHGTGPAADRSKDQHDDHHDHDPDMRILTLQGRLDAFVKGIASLGVPLNGAEIAIQDLRQELGHLDPFFTISQREHPSSGLELLQDLEQTLARDERTLEAVTGALVRTGRTTSEAIAERREHLSGLGHRNGARIVARAWTDPDFRDRLVRTGREAVRELGIPPGRLGILGVAENTEDIHNVVVCSLCSCYPHDVLGNPPWWYRTTGYREQIIADPRRMLRTVFGLELPERVTVRVHDSTSDVRWMVLPLRPDGTDHLSEEALAALVTPESLVGTAHAGDNPPDPRRLLERLADQ